MGNLLIVRSSGMDDKKRDCSIRARRRRLGCRATGRVLWLIVAGLALGFATPELMAQTRRVSRPVENVFLSQDGVFQFRYSDSLVRCKPEGSAESPSPDSHDAECTRCDDHAVACLAYPADEYRGYNFTGASFSVSIFEDANTKTRCLTDVNPNYCKPLLRTEMHHGVKFKTADCGEGGVSHYLDEQIYRTFYDAKCYQLSIRMAGTQIASYDPGIVKEFTGKDWKKVHRRLQRLIETFRFRR
jgi:hypothetical protein